MRQRPFALVLTMVVGVGRVPSPGCAADRSGTARGARGRFRTRQGSSGSGNGMFWAGSANSTIRFEGGGGGGIMDSRSGREPKLHLGCHFVNPPDRGTRETTYAKGARGQFSGT